MKNIFILLILLTSQISVAQSSKYYTLEKGGKKFPKIVRYLLIDNDDGKINTKKGITFDYDNQIFDHLKSKHKIDTCKISQLGKFQITSIKQLFKDEYNEFKKRVKEEKLKSPVMPLNHYNTRIFILEKISDETFIKYEVDWVYSVS